MTRSHRLAFAMLSAALFTAGCVSTARARARPRRGPGVRPHQRDHDLRQGRRVPCRERRRSEGGRRGDLGHREVRDRVVWVMDGDAIHVNYGRLLADARVSRARYSVMANARGCPERSPPCADYATLPSSASACSSHNRMSISRYILVAAARCSWACSRWSVRR
jgi:hypothetical protein